MRIFYAFLVVVSAAILLMLPITQGIYDFRTDQRTDLNTITTGVAETTGNVTLFKAVYNDDVSTIGITSNLYTDNATYTSYNATSRLLVFDGLTASSVRVISVAYDTDALTSGAAIATFIGKIDFIWLLLVLAFVPAALAAIFMGKAD